MNLPIRKEGEKLSPLQMKLEQQDVLRGEWISGECEVEGEAMQWDGGKFLRLLVLGYGALRLRCVSQRLWRSEVGKLIVHREGSSGSGI